MAGADLTGWAGRRVFVTGYSGFVGSWLSVLLRRLGAEVVGYARTVDEHTKLREQWLGEFGVTGVTGDVRDFAALHAAMAAAHCDVVVHLAAQPLVSVGYRQPHETLETNVQGSLNVLESARRCRPGAMIHVTSDKCYRNQGWPWPYREIDALGGGCPYSVSKAMAELAFEAYAPLYRDLPDGTRAASVRFGNVIGGGDHAGNRLVPDCLAALAECRPIALRCADAVRPWQHVLDVAHGLVLLADRLADGAVPAGSVYNFAPPHDGATVDRLAEELIRAWGSGSITRAPAADFGEDRILRLDGRRAAAELGWRHRLDVVGSAAWIVRWQQAVLSGVAPADATARQVDEFLAGLALDRSAESPAFWEVSRP